MKSLILCLLITSTIINYNLCLNKHRNYYYAIGNNSDDDKNGQDSYFNSNSSNEFSSSNKSLMRVERQTSGSGRDTINNLFNWQTVMKRILNWRSCNQNQVTTSAIYFSELNSFIKFEARINRNTKLENLRESMRTFNPKNPTYFIIHGYLGCSLNVDDYTIKIKELILFKRDANVFIVDWSHMSNYYDYRVSQNSTQTVAQDLLQLLSNLQLAFPGFSIKDVHLIGYSLGAHISGLLGRLTDGQVRQIIALDPAGPGYSDRLADFKLSSDDARYVLAIHTNGRGLGTKMNVADHDIFVNGGEVQPNCVSNMTNNLLINVCSHGGAPRSVTQLIDGKCMMVAHRCPSWDKYSNGECGFCKISPNDCLSLASDWQYSKSDIGKIVQRTQVPSTKKGAIDVEWTEGKRKYFIKTGIDQSCDKFSESKSEQWSMDIKIGNNFNYPLSSMRQLKSNTNVTIFDEKGTTKQINGPNIFVALLTIESDSAIYNLMPMKIKQAVINISQKDSNAVVYLNYLSHLSTGVRREMSGRVNNVAWNLSPAKRQSQPPEENGRFVIDRMFRRRFFANN